MDEFCAKVPFVPLCFPKSAQNTGYFENALRNTSVLCISRTKKVVLASAEGASGEILEHSTRFYAKVPFVPLCLPKSAQNAEYFENAQRISAFCAPPEPRENGARERRRRERRKFEAFYASFTQKRLLHHFAWHKVHKTHSTLRILQSHSFTNTRVLCAPPEQKETMLASVEGASGENLEHSTRVLRKCVFRTTALGKKCTKH